MFNSDARKALFSNANNIQKIRDIGKQMIMDRTSNGQFGVAEDVLDSIISELRLEI
jgi:high-affinity K+ transport system ATPase subunit B